MFRRDPRRLPRLKHWHRLTVAALPLLGAGCTDAPPFAALFVRPGAVIRAAEEESPGEPLVLVQAVETLPAPAVDPSPGAPILPSPSPGGEGQELKAPKVVPITLDTVLRMAEDQNLQVSQARARVDEAEAQYDLASKFLPELWIGNAYYRHEGGIQIEQGNLIHSSTDAMLSGIDLKARLDLKEFAYQKLTAEKKTWEQRGNLSKLTADTLLEAATTYIDLLAALSGKMVALQLERELSDLLNRAERLAETEPGARVEVARVRTELESRRQNVARLEIQASAAARKLVYLLGLDPCSQLMPVDIGLVPFHMVDVNLPCDELVARALDGGPGIRETAGLVSMVEEAMRKAQGPARFFPVVETRMTEGAFGAAPNDALTYDNRWDFYIQVRWNLSELHTRKERARIGSAQRAQAHLAHDDVRARLTAGVYEARESILIGSDEMRIAGEQVRYARAARDLSRKRLEDLPGTSYTEVLLSLQSLGGAQLNYLNAVREYDKAQLRLMVLTGGCHSPVAAPPPKR